MTAPGTNARTAATTDTFLRGLRSQAREERSRSLAISPIGWIAILAPVLAVAVGASIAFAT